MYLIQGWLQKECAHIEIRLCMDMILIFKSGNCSSKVIINVTKKCDNQSQYYN